MGRWDSRRNALMDDLKGKTQPQSAGWCAPMHRTDGKSVSPSVSHYETTCVWNLPPCREWKSVKLPFVLHAASKRACVKWAFWEKKIVWLSLFIHHQAVAAVNEPPWFIPDEGTWTDLLTLSQLSHSHLHELVSPLRYGRSITGLSHASVSV